MRHHVDHLDVPRWLRERRSRWLIAVWLSRPRDPEDAARVRAIYRECRRRRARGEDVVVDHIVALNDPFACGLHHSANLRIVPERVNVAKSNGPDHPDLFGWTVEPHQLRLAI